MNDGYVVEITPGIGVVDIRAYHRHLGDATTRVTVRMTGASAGDAALVAWYLGWGPPHVGLSQLRTFVVARGIMRDQLLTDLRRLDAEARPHPNVAVVIEARP